MAAAGSRFWNRTVWHLCLCAAENDGLSFYGDAFCIPDAVTAVVIFSLNHGGSKPGDTWSEGSPSQEENTESRNPSQEENMESKNPSQEETAQSQTGSPGAQTDIEDGFILISGGTFEMGSPNEEANYYGHYPYMIEENYIRVFAKGVRGIFPLCKRVLACTGRLKPKTNMGVTAHTEEKILKKFW